MCVRLSRVWGDPWPVSGIAEIATYAGTEIDLCNNAFATSVSVSENAQKYFGESTYLIVSTRSVQIMTQFSTATDGMA